MKRWRFGAYVVILAIVATMFSFVAMRPGVNAAAGDAGTVNAGAWMDQYHIYYDGRVFTGTHETATADDGEEQIVWIFRDSNRNCISNFQNGNDTSYNNNYNAINNNGYAYLLKNPTGAQYRERDPASDACGVGESHYITLDSTLGNHRADFYWVDDNTIRTVWGTTFVRNTNGHAGGRPNLAEFYEEGGEPCDDGIHIENDGRDGQGGHYTYYASWPGDNTDNPPYDNYWAITNSIRNADPQVSGSCTSTYNHRFPVDVSNFYLQHQDTQPPPTGGAGGDGSDDSIDDNCPIEQGRIERWAGCPLYLMMNEAITMLDGFIDEYMTTGNKIYDTDAEPNYKNAWAVFRNLALGFIVIAGLVMLASEAFGLAVIDAYTVRKVLPKLLVAIVGISLSWEVCKFLILFFDDLGHAIGDIIYSSFNVNPATTSLAQVLLSQLVAGGIATAGALLLTSGGVLSLAGSLGIALLFFAIMLIIRQAIIVAAVIVAPAAIALYALPNTGKYAGIWWNTFLRMLMLYPMIIGIMALTRSLATIT